jgi:hypothetical protein
MMKNLSFQYPAWFLLFCALAGIVYALVLYYRDRTFREQSPHLATLLGVLRFLTVALLSALLLAPLLRSLLLDTRKPIVVLAQDHSESIAADMNEEQLAAYKQRFEALARDLARIYELRQYAFGSHAREEIDFELKDKSTNISRLIQTVHDLYSNQNLGAVIVATDGIYNEGSNPVYAAAKLNAPVYAIALGDTIPKRDVVVRRVFHNRIVYLGDQFSIQVDVAARNCAGSASSLAVYRVEGDGRQLLRQMPLNIDSDDFFITRELTLEADRPGVQRYQVVVAAVPGEAAAVNNSKEIFIDVLDARQKILLLANAPHPDISALRQSISANKNYQVSVNYINELKENPAEFDFVVLHQLPSRTYDIAGLLNTLNQRKTPRLFIVGAQTNLPRFNQLQSLVAIQGDGRNINDVQARFAPEFSLFNIDEELNKLLPTFSPLQAPFGEYRVGGDAQPLLFQRIGRIDTRYPLLVLGQDNDIKTGVFCAEGIWRWRLFDFLQHNNHELFNELVGKTVQYLSLKEDKRRFRVNLSKNIFDENEPAIFDAELYNQSYELINEPDVSMTIVDGEGKEYPFVFTKTGNAYTLDAGILPVGNYRFRAMTISGGQELSYSGQFSVRPIQLEQYETTADHGLLRLLSERFGGAVVYPSEMDRLPAMLAERSALKPVVYQTAQTRSVINLKWIFFLLLFLLSGEWFLRRYFGSY